MKIENAVSDLFGGIKTLESIVRWANGCNDCGFLEFANPEEVMLVHHIATVSLDIDYPYLWEIEDDLVPEVQKALRELQSIAMYERDKAVEAVIDLKTWKGDEKDVLKKKAEKATRKFIKKAKAAIALIDSLESPWK